MKSISTRQRIWIIGAVAMLIVIASKRASRIMLRMSVCLAMLSVASQEKDTG
jgi:hypothetical protein